MSHTVSLDPQSGTRFFTITVVNYTQGGEAMSLADVFATALDGAVLGIVAADKNSLGVPLLPLLDGASIKLYQFSAGSFAEIPTTTALNAIISAIVSIKN